MMAKLMLAFCLVLAVIVPGLAEAKGDLSTRPTELERLVLGPEESGYGMSVTKYQLET